MHSGPVHTAGLDQSHSRTLSGRTDRRVFHPEELPSPVPLGLDLLTWGGRKALASTCPVSHVSGHPLLSFITCRLPGASLLPSLLLRALVSSYTFWELLGGHSSSVLKSAVPLGTGLGTQRVGVEGSLQKRTHQNPRSSLCVTSVSLRLW